MTDLPIDSHLAAIADLLRAHRALVLVAPPGAGKTTRVPPALLRAGVLDGPHSALVMLQPRRVAARATAERIALENGWSLGEEVGYQIRFERKVGPRTRLKVLTEGILTRQLMADPFLEGVGAVVLDEFHERSIHTDFALALLREVQQSVRDDLCLIVMSATMEAEPVAQFLGDAPIVRVEGRTFPVDIAYRPTIRPGSAEAVRGAVEEALAAARGDLLVFLPGADEIRRAGAALEPLARSDDLLVVPLHGSLTGDDQDRALRPSAQRKVVLATNIAETSLTIDGVDTVIDSGLARVASFDPARGLDRLELERISRASADQRAGRAGRTGPGRCVRLWAEREQRGLISAEPPEIVRVDLAATVLALHAWGQSDPGRFGWFERPPRERVDAAEGLLVMLGALTGEGGAITLLGRKLLDLPVHPRLGRLLLAARDDGHIRTGAALAALLSEKDIALAQAPGHERGRGASDVLFRLDLLHEAERARFAPRLRDRGIDVAGARRVAKVRDDLLRAVRRGASVARADEPDEETMLRWLLLAYPDRVARRRGGEATGVMVGGRGVRLAPESVVRDAELFLALDPRQDRRGGALHARVRLASAIRIEWLEEFFPEALQRETIVRYDEGRRRVESVNTLTYRGLSLREDPHAAVDPEAAGAALADALRPRARELFEADESAAAWLARLDLLRRAQPERTWPELDDAALGDVLADVCVGKRSVDAVLREPLVPALRNHLGYESSRLLDELAPEALTVPSGSRIRLRYEPGRPPVLAVRLQELFGWTDTPRVAGGRVPVVLHLLGPNFRPVQITEDLRSFWTTTYFQVRKDLRARYPRHAWPEDPLHAKPEAKGGRRRDP